MLVIKHEQHNVSGSLKPLHPFLVDMGLLRGGGRLQTSTLSYNQKQIASDHVIYYEALLASYIT